MTMYYQRPKNPTKAQRQAMLAAVDNGGRLPDGLSSLLLAHISQAWIAPAADSTDGALHLTAEGRDALAPDGRFKRLEEANPETCAMPSLNHAERQSLARDGLIELREGWPYITVRGRRLVGMPLVRPDLPDHLALDAQALWRQPGKPDVLVSVRSWPFADGTVRCYHRGRGPYLDVLRPPAVELLPIPAKFACIR
ncbi:hypothetical protein [Streptomyces sp. NPDC046685]|uniref:hypothetical protein n=1 Tax=Streptomyces sp. NPDC046685 TaxID=3157202 RepID=UPI00340B6461